LKIKCRKKELIRTFSEAEVVGVPFSSSLSRGFAALGRCDGYIICWHWADVFFGFIPLCRCFISRWCWLIASITCFQTRSLHEYFPTSKAFTSSITISCCLSLNAEWQNSQYQIAFSIFVFLSYIILNGIIVL